MDINKGKERLEAMVAAGRTRAAEVLARIEAEQPTDAIVSAQRLHFGADEDTRGLDMMRVGEEGFGHLHGHALRQACDRVKFPGAYAEMLAQSDLVDFRQLAAVNLNRLYAHDGGRYLVRTVKGEVRGFLSDHYRRMDSRPIIERFAMAAQDVGALPFDGYALETKVALKAILPQVFEPVPGEFLAYGVVIETSDYGDGALNVAAFCLRVVCANGAIADTLMRRVHLGRRLDDSLEYSRRTYQLDTAATASAVGDMVKGQLAPATVERWNDVVRRAASEPIDAKAELARLRRGTLTKAETESVAQAFNSPDVEQVPAGNTAWRLSNAISWVAGQTEDRRRSLELQHVAAEVLPQAA